MAMIGIDFKISNLFLLNVHNLLVQMNVNNM